MCESYNLFNRGGAGKMTTKFSAKTVLDRAFDEIVPESATIEQLAEGFGLAEGPVWMPEGYLLFSDVVNNVIHKWDPSGEVSVFRKQSGYSAETPFRRLSSRLKRPDLGPAGPTHCVPTREPSRGAMGKGRSADSTGRTL